MLDGDEGEGVLLGNQGHELVRHPLAPRPRNSPAKYHQVRPCPTHRHAQHAQTRTEDQDMGGS
jgi:hypothetical protein